MGQDPEGLTLVVSMFKFSHIGFGLTGFSEHQDCGLFNGPFEMVITDFLVAVPGPFAVGLFDWLDQACIRGKILNSWESFGIMDLVQHH